MNITIDMIEQVLDATEGDYRVIKQALIDAEGDVDKAIETVKAAQAQAAAEPEATVIDIDISPSGQDDETSEECGAERTAAADEDNDAGEKPEDEEKKKADWTTDEFAEDMVERIKRRISEGNVDHIRIRKGEKTLLDIPVNLGLLGGLIGMVTIPWAMVLGILTAYGMNCKVEIINKDGGKEDL